MSFRKEVAVDANILLRAVFGKRVRLLLRTHEDSIAFCAPDICFVEAERYIPAISERRGVPKEFSFAILKNISMIVQTVDRLDYQPYETRATARIRHRDVNDWPVIATTLLLNCPLWTEDHDFFGTGIATWTTQTIELYLQDGELAAE